MAGETVITVIGNITADPELKFTANSAAVANFTIASTPRTFDRQSADWKDGGTLFLRCSVWRDMAERVADSLSRGTRVIAQGRLKSRTFDTKEGEPRTVFELDVDEIGPSLRYATVAVTRVDRHGQPQQASGGQQGESGQQRGGNPGWQYGDGAQQAQQGGSWGSNPNPQQDPWTQHAMAQQGDEPPF